MWSPLLLLLLLTLACAAWCRVGAAPCSSSLSAAAYRVQLRTAWTRESFPQHYPEWRPPAQWSPLVGRSHDSSFVLFRVGLVASAGLKLFAETGRDEGLDGTQGERGVLDAFRATAISAGAGSTTTAFFVDGNHTKVSVISRLVPSPDWFVGLDSIELCSGEHWLPSLTIEGHVLDAGTNNGLTFTAPKWATHPQGKVLPLESGLLPPGASFHYPHIEKLPPIASFHFTKVREYRVVDDQRSEVMPDQQLDGLQPAVKQSANNSSVSSVFRSLPPASPQLLLPRGDKDAIVNSIVDKYRRRDGRKLAQRPAATKPRRPPRDCRVSHWAAWGPCSKTCGIGETRRVRQVVKPARRGGNPCPLLHQSKWCAAEPCAAFFRWSST
ncbi:spondin-2 isoform X2 [Ischnura elegans]|uniref:spondin-2 isoform X2 n=1 Tax=Ischnura elegans TaxID=197161 RepID=UPI001ED8917E|nr:spondin-2 isoform X2 [Ischnura elegans]